MEQAQWLKRIRLQSEALYDHIAPLNWESFGFYPNSTHLQFIDKFLEQLRP
jgi:hypothetical protein